MSALNHKHYYNTINFDSDYIKLDTLEDTCIRLQRTWEGAPPYAGVVAYTFLPENGPGLEHPLPFPGKLGLV